MDQFSHVVEIMRIIYDEEMNLQAKRIS